MKNSHLDRILGKIDDLDPSNLNILVKRLAKERHLLETVFNSIKDGIIVINNQGIIEYANKSAINLIHIKDSDIASSPIWKLVPDLAFLINNIRPTSLDLQINYPDKRFLNIYICPISENPNESLFALILSDTTEDRLNTQELIENEKLSSIFMLAAGVAHELGNPLNSINIHLQLIQRQLEKLQLPQSKKIQHSLDSAISEVARLDSLILNFLNAIKPTPLDLVECNLLEILNDTLSVLSQELQNDQISIEIQLDRALPIVLADPNQIKQVFYNIIKNAAEAMLPGGKLIIATETNDDHATFHFTDNGSGINQDELSHIFEPYFSTKKSGHGLGMMVVQRIIRDHGGQISVQSIQNQGTTVTIQFPLKSKRIKMLQAN